MPVCLKWKDKKNWTWVLYSKKTELNWPSTREGIYTISLFVLLTFFTKMKVFIWPTIFDLATNVVILKIFGLIGCYIITFFLVTILKVKYKNKHDNRTSLTLQQKTKIIWAEQMFKSLEKARIELATYSMRRNCDTTTPFPQRW